MDSLFQAFSVNAFENDLSEMNSFTNWLGPSDPKCMGCSIMRLRQCSPYQAVTGKFYCLSWHFLPPATAWKFTKIKFVVLKSTQVVISDPMNSHKEMNEYNRKVIKYTQLFFLWATHFGKRTFETLVKLLESNFLNCCLKIAFDLHKIGLKMRE